MKRIEIEHLLRWAYRDELPKLAAPRGLVAAIRPGWLSMSRFSELMTVVQETDMVNRYGVSPLLAGGDDEPHPDALLVAEAVEALAGCDVGVPDDWSPLSDMGDLGPEGAEAVRRGIGRLMSDGRLRDPLSRLVIRHAILGAAPDWEAEPVTRRVVTEHGKPKWFRAVEQTSSGAFGPVSTVVEIDGFDARRRRPYPGAYQKFELTPDPAETVRSRGEYELWVFALGFLAEDLAARGLTAHSILPSNRPPRPWEAGISERRILPSMLAPAFPVRGSRKKNSIAA